VRHLIGLSLLALAVGVGATGCGGDSSGETTTGSASVSSVTAPSVSTGSTTAGTLGKTKTTKGGKTYNPTAPDSSTNDVPPLQGGPQAGFEQHCRQDPSACR
jgi:hypothetical protein